MKKPSALIYAIGYARHNVQYVYPRRGIFDTHDTIMHTTKGKMKKRRRTIHWYDFQLMLLARKNLTSFVRSFVMHYRSIDIHRSPLCYVPDGRMKRGATSVLTSRESFLLTDKKLNRTRATLVYVGRYHVGRERWAFYLSLFTDDKMHLHFLH